MHIKKSTYFFLAFIFLASSVVLAQQHNGWRHYFEHCKEHIDPPLAVGMTRDEVRELAGGREYPLFETVRGGFAFALNEKRSDLYVFQGWMPQSNAVIDFFVSDNKVIYVRYGTNNRAAAVSVYPLRSTAPSHDNHI